MLKLLKLCLHKEDGVEVKSVPRRTVVFPGRFLFTLIFVELIGLACLSSSYLLAQTDGESGQVETTVSRALNIQKEREAKVATLVPPERGSFEKGLNKIEQGMGYFNAVMGSFHGFHYTTGGFPAGAGWGYGLGFTQNAIGHRYEGAKLANRIDFDAAAAYSTRSYYRIGTSVLLQNIAGSPLSIGVAAEGIEFPEEDFFGLGPGSSESARSDYLLRSLHGGADIWLEPVRGLRLGGGAHYLSPSIGSGQDPRYPTVENVFDSREIPGWQVQPDFFRYDGYVDFDFRDKPMYPRSGGYYGARFSNYRDRDFNRYDFRQWTFDGSQYIQLPNQYRVLALRANVVMSDSDTGFEVPFYYMPDLGGAIRLRGFREYRFRDENALLLSAEYRWEAWWAMDMALFVDAGKVARRKADIDFKDLEYGYGFGLRFHSSKALVARLDFAFSKERFIPLLRFEHVF